VAGLQRTRDQAALLTPEEASGQPFVVGPHAAKPAEISLACGKPAFLRCFGDPAAKKRRFSSVFRGFSLAFSKSLGYSPERPGFSVHIKRGESAAGLNH